MRQGGKVPNSRLVDSIWPRLKLGMTVLEVTKKEAIFFFHLGTKTVANVSHLLKGMKLKKSGFNTEELGESIRHWKSHGKSQERGGVMVGTW